MKFGIMNLFPSAGEAEDHQVLHDTLEEIRIADQLGFDSVWLAEHHFSRYGILGNPLQFGAAIAAGTDRIMIGTAVMVVPFHDPIRLAEEGAALDVISKGRFQMGVGRGYQPREFKGFGVDPAESRERYDEAMEIVQRAWTQEGWSFRGRHFSYEDLTTYPRPYQDGGPPLVHGAVSPSSFRKRGLAGANIITSPSFTPLGRMKDNFDVYRASLVEAGHDPADFELPFMQQIWVGAGTAGLREAAEAALRYYRSVGKVIPGSEEALASEAAYYAKVRENIELLTLEQTLTHGGNFGSVGKVVETLGLLNEELGVTHYIGWFRIPSLARSSALRAMETFASEVMPQLQSTERLSLV